VSNFEKTTCAAIAVVALVAVMLAGGHHVAGLEAKTPATIAR